MKLRDLRTASLHKDTVLLLNSADRREVRFGFCHHVRADGIEVGHRRACAVWLANQESQQVNN